MIIFFLKRCEEIAFTYRNNLSFHNITKYSSISTINHSNHSLSFIFSLISLILSLALSFSHSHTHTPSLSFSLIHSLTHSHTHTQRRVPLARLEGGLCVLAAAAFLICGSALFAREKRARDYERQSKKEIAKVFDDGLFIIFYKYFNRIYV